MSQGQMGFQDISRSLDRGDLLHKDLKPQNTGKSVLGRFFIWIKKTFTRNTDYHICTVSESILKKAATTQVDRLDAKEKAALVQTLAKLRLKLRKKDSKAIVVRNLLQQATALHRSLAPNQPAVKIVANPMRSKRGTRKIAVPSNALRGPALPKAVAANLVYSTVFPVPITPLSTIIDRSFMAAEIEPHLKTIFDQRGKSATEIRALAKKLCLLLNSKQEEIDVLKGNSIRFSKNTPIDVGGGRTITLPFSGWIKINEDGTGMRLQIIPPEAAIGKGTYKKVKKSFAFYLPISRSPDGSRDIHMTQAVIQRIKDKPYIDQRGRTYSGNEIKTVESGLDYQRSILALSGSGNRLVAAPDAYAEYTGKKGSKKLETYQEWLIGDLHQAIATGVIPLDIDQTRYQVVSFRDKLRIASDLSHSLEAMHSAGFVHRDVKPANILLKSENGEIHGYLSDFDLTTKPGMTDIVSNYLYWDSSSQQGYASFAADVIGCAMTVAETMIPDFYAKYNADRTILAFDADEKHIEEARSHLKESLSKMSLHPDQVKTILQAFGSERGYTEEFGVFLNNFAAGPHLNSPQSTAIKKLAIDIKYFNSIFTTVSNLVSSDVYVTQALAALSAPDAARMETDPAFKAQVLEQLIVEARFPSMRELSAYFSNLETHITAEYAAAGLS